MDDLNFCTACGKELPSGTTYCPACGTRLNDPEGDRRENAKVEKETGDRIKIAVILLLITAAVSFISGIYLYVNAAGMAEWMAKIVSDPVLTDDFYRSIEGMFRMSALMSIAGGAVALISAFLTYKRRMYALAFVTCIVAAVIGNLIIGLIALYMVYKSKAAFTD